MAPYRRARMARTVRVMEPPCPRVKTDLCFDSGLNQPYLVSVIESVEHLIGAQYNQITVLVVDDDPEILKVVSSLLVGGGYHVLAAHSGEAALQQSKAYKGEIHLLLSDFEMPVMNGIELATQMTLERPQIKVLLMSGFTGGMLVLNEGWHFLAKPFIPSQLRALIHGLVPDKSPNS